MATCTNCNHGTTANGFFTGSNTFPGSQFGFYADYPSTCPGGCLYLTSSGYRCSNSTIGTCTRCGKSHNNSGCGCGCGSR